MSADNSEGTEDGKKRDLLGKKRDSKKAQKDQGYVKFDEDDSDTSHLNPEDIKSPSKAKKSKPFFKKQKQKEEKKEKEGKKEEKEKEKKKDEKDGKKKIKGKKKSKHEPVQVSLPEEVEKPIFGVPLSVAVERNPSHDGIELPRLFRECVDYIEEHGLTCEGIYRISGVKSKIQMLKDCYNRGAPVYLEEHEPNIIASLLKQFLRELPDPVLTKTLMPKFEEASVVRGEIARSEAFKKLIAELPTCNRLLLSWMIVHMTHVIEQAKENKMSLQNVSIVLSPTMQISHRVLNVLFQSASKLFSDVQLKRYKPPIKPTTSRWSLELPESLVQMEEELMKQESLLNALHKEMNEGVTNQDKEEQLWEVQRVVTQLKRKIKQATKEAAGKRKKEESRPPTVAEDDELKLDLREVPIKQQAPPPPQDIKTEIKAEAPPPSDDNVNQASVKQQAPPPPQDIKTEIKGETPPPSDVNQASVTQQAPPPQEQESIKVEAPPPDDLASNQMIEKKEETNQGSEDKEEIKNEGKQDGKDEIDSNKIRSIQETHQREHVEEETMKGQPESKDREVPDKLDKQEREEDDREGLAQTVDTVIKDEKNQEVPEDSDKKTLITKVLDQNTQVVNSSEDEFENAVEKILEGEKGTAKEWTDESASEAGITDYEDRDEIKEKHASQEKVSHADVEILKTETAVDSSSKDHTENETGEDSETDYEYVDDDEVMKLRDEEQALKLEEEELIAIESELRKKIETEKREIERLNQEIDELKYLRQDSDLEDYSSETDSSYESEDEDDLQEILGQLIQENENLEKKNAELCSKIHEERMICLDVKVQIRMLQQKQLESSLSIHAILG